MRHVRIRAHCISQDSDLMDIVYDERYTVGCLCISQYGRQRRELPSLHSR